jgi:predicted metalloprotease with PDZ domain
VNASHRRRHLAALSPGLLVLACSCVTTEAEKVPPPVNVSADGFAAPEAAVPPADLGLEVEANESDALDRLEVLPGARVRSVSPGGPASHAGIAPGDVVLSVGGAATNGRDAFLAAAAAAGPGKVLSLEVRRGTTVFQAKVAAGPAPAGAPPVELYRVDPVKLRAAFRTVVVETGGRRRTAAEVAKLLEGSPLERAGIRPGERIAGLSGKEIASAQDLVRRILDEHDYGDRVTLTCLRDGEEVAVRVRLWAPRRRLTRLLVPVLFDYEWKLRPRTTRWSILDFWVLSLFEYRREEGERELRFLRWLRFRTGYGELVEEPR